LKVLVIHKEEVKKIDCHPYAQAAQGEEHKRSAYVLLQIEAV
jgi:hypothetical protein